MYLGHRAEVCTLIAQAELKSRTAKKSVKLIVSVLRCSHSFPLALARPLLGDHGMAIPISSRRSIAPGRSMSLSPSLPTVQRAAWPVRVTDDCDTKPAKVLNCLYSAAAAAIDEWVSIYPPPETPASLLPLPQDEERVRRYKVVINFEQQFQQPQG